MVLRGQSRRAKFAQRQAAKMSGEQIAHERRGAVGLMAHLRCIGTPDSSLIVLRGKLCCGR
jgi:hypothetical protein